MTQGLPTSRFDGVDRHAPIFYVLVQPEGAKEAERVDTTDTVLSFSFEDNESKADLLKLEVDNWDLGAFDSPIWRPGNLLIVTWGYAGFLAPKRECIIQKVKGSIKLSIEAQAKSVLMNKITHARTFDGMKRSDVARAVAREYGYGDAVTFIEDTGDVCEHVVQAHETDAQFLRRLATQEHFQFYVDQAGFHWHSRKLAQQSLRVLQYYLPPNVGDILSFDVENDIFAKPAKVVAVGRDPVKKSNTAGTGSNGETDRKALNPVIEIIDKSTGIATYQVRNATEETKPTTSTNPKKDADGTFKKAVLATVKLKIDMVGDPGIVAKSVLDIRGISKRLSGKYYVNECVHTIDSGGYKLSLKCSTDGTGGHFENLLDADKDGKKGDALGPIKPPVTQAMADECKRQLEKKFADFKQLVPAWPGRGHPVPKPQADDPTIQKISSEIAAYEQRCQSLQDAVGKADLSAPPAKPDVREKVDPATGLTALEYHPTEEKK